MMAPLYMNVDRVGVWCIVIVVPGCVSEGGFGFVRWVINNRHTIFDIFTPEFGDEGEMTYAIDIGLYVLNVLDELAEERVTV